MIEYIAPTEKYLERRKGTIADILMPTASTFTNKIDTDTSLVNKKRLISPTFSIVFRKDLRFTMWDSNVIAEYNGEKCPEIYMRPYLDGVYSQDQKNSIIARFDARAFTFKNLITFKKFQKELSLLRPVIR